jgi:alpha-glucosidase
MMKKICLLSALLLTITLTLSGAQKTLLNVSSPDGSLALTVNVDEHIGWTLKKNGEVVATSPTIAMTLERENVLGYQAAVRRSSVVSHKGVIHSDLYKKFAISDEYNALTLELKGNYTLVFRMYNAGMAYRFETALKGDITVLGETIDLDFPNAKQAWVPYIRESIHRYQASYESPYVVKSFDEVYADSLIILPFLIENEDGTKVVITEADL